ncbi:hypothetical protein SRHO_G00302620 [Serrasalmus rhombeus]
MPKDTSQLRQVLGMVNYRGKFLPGFFTELNPLTDLLKKDSAHLWDTLQRQAFGQPSLEFGQLQDQLQPPEGGRELLNNQDNQHHLCPARFAQFLVLS